MENGSTGRQELSPEEVIAKAAILAECENLAAAGVTFVAVHFSNAFTSAFKELDPIPQFRATTKLGEFLEARFSQPF